MSALGGKGHGGGVKIVSLTAAFADGRIVVSAPAGSYDVNLGAPFYVISEPDGTVLNYRIGVWADGTLDNNYLPVTLSGTYSIRVYQTDSKNRVQIEGDTSVIVP